MKPSAVKTKLVTLFILAFLCLNVGGTVCLAYCRGMIATTAMSSHCPKHAAMAHQQADTRESRDRVSQLAERSGSGFCLSLPVNLFSAPVEKKHFTAGVALMHERPIVRHLISPAVFLSEAPPPPKFVPPKIDMRDLRVKNCVIRI